MRAHIVLMDQPVPRGIVYFLIRSNINRLVADLFSFRSKLVYSLRFEECNFTNSQGEYLNKDKSLALLPIKMLEIMAPTNDNACFSVHRHGITVSDPCHGLHDNGIRCYESGLNWKVECVLDQGSARERFKCQRGSTSVHSVKTSRHIYRGTL